MANIPDKISRIELGPMFCRDGKVINSFILIIESSRRNHGFAIVHFKFEREADAANDFARGRYWGGRKINVQIVKYGQRKVGNQDSKDHGNDSWFVDAGKRSVPLRRFEK